MKGNKHHRPSPPPTRTKKRTLEKKHRINGYIRSRYIYYKSNQTSKRGKAARSKTCFSRNSREQKNRARVGACAARFSSGLAPGGLMTQGKSRQNYALRKFKLSTQKSKSINFSHTRGRGGGGCCCYLSYCLSNPTSIKILVLLLSYLLETTQPDTHQFFPSHTLLFWPFAGVAKQKNATKTGFLLRT